MIKLINIITQIIHVKRINETQSYNIYGNNINDT